MRAKEELQKLENDNFINTQDTFSLFAGSRKKQDVQASGEPRQTKIVPPTESILNFGSANEVRERPLVISGSAGE